MSKNAFISIVRSPDLPIYVIKAWRRAVGRARRSGIPCTLSRDELEVLWKRCEGRCAVSGLEFTDEEFPNALVKRPYAPSIDQIEATKGYTLENARITCVAANFAMNQWGLGTLRRLALAVVRREKEEAGDERQWYRRQNEKLQEAEQVALSLSGQALAVQKHRIAGQKRAITMGPLNLTRAARKANKTIVRSPVTKATVVGRETEAEVCVCNAPLPTSKIAELKAHIECGEYWVPTVGDVIYVGTRISIDHEWTDLTGGLALVTKISKGMSGGDPHVDFISVSESGGRSYNWTNFLFKDQRRLIEEFGDGVAQAVSEFGR